MNWPRAPLRKVAPPERTNVVFANDDVVWQLSLDQIESQTGRILKKVRARAADAGNSTFAFDAKHVLYSKLRPYLNKVARPDEPGLATTELVPLRPVPGVLDADFLTFYLRSDAFVNFANLTVAGAKMPRMIMDRFWEHRVPVPTPREQRRIVELLEQADALRRQRAEADALADRILPALFRKMFGDPDRNPRRWATKRIGDVCEVTRGASPRPISAFMGGTVPWIKIGDGSSSGPYLSSTAEFVTDEGAAKSVRVPAGSLIVANSGVSCGFARILRIDGCIHDGWLALLNISQEVEPLYLLAFINEMTLELRRRAPGGTQPNLNIGLVENVRLPVPPPRLQADFARSFEEFYTTKDAQFSASKNIETLFQTMLHRAFTGELTACWREARMKELLTEMEQQARILNVNGATP